MLMNNNELLRAERAATLTVNDRSAALTASGLMDVAVGVDVVVIPLPVSMRT